MTDRSRYQPTMALSPTRALAAALLALAVWAAPAGAAPATYGGIAADGHLALFSTAEKMVPGDTDNKVDVYARAKDATLGEYVTREVSIGPLGGNDAYDVQYDGISGDGTRAFFSTKEALVAADGDHEEDVYMRDLVANTTTLVSRGDGSCAGSGCGNGAVPAGFVPRGVVPAGDRVFFTTTEKLSSADTDSVRDVYMRDLEAGETVLVSAGDGSCAGEGCGNGPDQAVFEQASEDGEKVVFSSDEGLVAGDADGASDIYMRDLEAGETALVTVPGACPEDLPVGQTCDPTFGGVSGDGSHVVFESYERISAADTDSFQDVYDWTGAGAALASLGTSGGDGEYNATYSQASGPSGDVYFYTDEALDPADEDGAQDVYVFSEGAAELVSTGPESRNGPAPASLAWASPSPSSPVAIFATTEALVPEDNDAKLDVYERSGGTTTLLSTAPEAGNGAFASAFAGASDDGARVFFSTAEPLVEEDEDAKDDIYLRAEGGTTLVSVGPVGGNGSFPPPGLHGVSDDGSQAFFTTEERLTVDDDFAGEEDVYQWSLAKSSSTTRLVSVKNAAELVLGPPPPTLEGTSPSSPGETTEPRILGQAEEGATITIYTSSSCSGEAVPPGGTAEELAGAGIPVTVAAGTKTTFYATAELEGVVSPCSNGIAYVQKAAPEEGGGGKEEGGGGSGGAGSGDPGAILDVLGSGGAGDAVPGLVFVTPKTLITFGPGAKTRKRKVVFRFADSTGQPGTRFRCKIDRQGWRKCRSPKRLRGLRLGRHVFQVKAVNAVGAWEPKPQKRPFKVVR
jgi:hypothetical protein